MNTGRSTCSQRPKQGGLWSSFLKVVVTVGMSMMMASSALAANPAPLGAGDEIELDVPSHPTLSKRYRLDESGMIELPYIGKQLIVGLTPTQASQKLRSGLSGYFRSFKSFTLKIYKRRKYVWIRGWVKKPGRHLLGWEDNVEMLLRRAGGARDGARLDKIWVYGPKSKPRKVNLFSYYRKAGKTPLRFLKRDSVVFVPVGKGATPEAGSKAGVFAAGVSKIAVLGAVKKPGVFPCFGRVNVLQALAMAEGTVRASSLREILITSSSGRTKWYDLAAYWRKQKGSSRLPQVAAGSVVFVPFHPIGASRKGPVRILGEVAKPGVWRGVSEKGVMGWLARSGGPTSNADLRAVNIVRQGNNFTIHQTVDLKQALREGNTHRLPNMRSGQWLVYVPKKQSKPQQLQDIQTILQIAISVTSVTSSVVLLAVTLSN